MRDFQKPAAAVCQLRKQFYKVKSVEGLRYNLSVLLCLKTAVTFRNF